MRSRAGVFIIIPMAIALFFFVLALTIYQQTLSYTRFVTPAELRAASANPCVAQELNARMAWNHNAIKVWNLEAIKRSCNEQLIAEQQKRALGIQ